MKVLDCLSVEQRELADQFFHKMLTAIQEVVSDDDPEMACLKAMAIAAEIGEDMLNEKIRKRREPKKEIVVEKLPYQKKKLLPQPRIPVRVSIPARCMPED